MVTRAHAAQLRANFGVFMQKTTDICTGGLRSRDIAQLKNLQGFALVGTLGSFFHIFDWGGPIDATSIIPAGSVNSTDWHDWKGKKIACQTELYRS